MSGAVSGLDVSSIYNIFASSAGNCKSNTNLSLVYYSFLAIRVNSIITQDVLSQRIFNTDVTSVKWFPSVVSEKINS